VAPTQALCNRNGKPCPNYKLAGGPLESSVVLAILSPNPPGSEFVVDNLLYMSPRRDPGIDNYGLLFMVNAPRSTSGATGLPIATQSPSITVPLLSERRGDYIDDVGDFNATAATPNPRPCYCSAPGCSVWQLSFSGNRRHPLYLKLLATLFLMFPRV